MRSRYTAYTQANIPYIVKTMRGPAAKNFDAEEAATWAKQVTWLQLEVKQAKTESTKGLVEFLAHYLQDNKKYCIHELSEFHFEEDQWYYVDGHVTQNNHNNNSAKISRNDPCPCGSTKKYKKCCGKND